MIIISHLHQVFNEEKCRTHIHELRWKDRQLQCPHCQSTDVKNWGVYHRYPEFKRYMCKGCNKTFNDLTGTILHGRKISLQILILLTFLLCLSCSCCRIKRELGVHIKTTYRWCWWFRNVAISYEVHRQLEGIVEADEIYQTAGNKGRSKTGKKELNHQPRKRGKKQPPGRGHYEKDSPAIIGVSRAGYTVLTVVKDFTIKTVQKAAEITVKTTIYTDSAKSYQALVGYTHDSVNHSQKEYARGDVHENRAENCFSLLRVFLAIFRGIGKHNLPGYIGFFQFLRNFRSLNAFQQSEVILHAALDPSIASKAKVGEFVKLIDHFELLHTAIN